MNPDISIIVPTYNDSQFIQDAINSILDQTLKKIEIIVVDDGSTDNTQKVLDHYIKNKLINYIYQTNMGVSAARNKGINHARGKYICFLDADDLLYPKTALQKRLELITKLNLDFIVTDFYWIRNINDFNNLHLLQTALEARGFLDAFGEPQNNYFLIDKQIFIYNCLKYIPPRLTTILAERNFILKNKIFFDEQLSVSEDLDFVWRVILTSKFNNIALLNEPTYIYMFNRATHHLNIDTSQKLIYYKKLISYLSKYVPRRALADRLYSDYWIYFQHAPFYHRLQLIKILLTLYPFDFKYWKSFFGLIIKRLNKL